jgi:DNA repair protein SbcD/Mre11
MRLVHLADLHLGYRQYQRVTPTGGNQREADVAGTFRRAVDTVIALRPDLVVFAGDVFHNVRPTNPAILLAFRQFARLTEALPGVPVVMVAGNHDLPRASDSSCILRLFESLGIQVADFRARRFAFPELELSVLAVPEVTGDRPDLSPDPSARHNVLVLHSDWPGVRPSGGVIDDMLLEAIGETLDVSQWTYVALGHYHTFREIGPNAFYSGSIDYTSSSVWNELREERERDIPGKGVIEYDLTLGVQRFHPVAPARALIELPPLNARGMTGPELDEALRAAVDACPGGIDGRIVRQVVTDVPRHINSDLDPQALREYKRRAFHYQFEPVRPNIRAVRGQGAPGQGQSLADFVRERLQTRTLPPDVDRDALIGRVFEYLDSATAAELAAAGEPDG